MGGLSTAIETGVEEVLLYRQTVHGLERATRRYMHLRDPALLLQTFEASRL
jgi:hypothetical protein